MNAHRALAALGLLLLAGCSSTASQAARDDALQAALESGRAACLVLLSDKSIQREQGVDEYCLRVLNGCGAADAKP